MEKMKNINQNPYVLKTSTIWHSDIQALPVIIYYMKQYINITIGCYFDRPLGGIY